MAERLGDVLYWLGCVVAILLAAGAAWVLLDTRNSRPEMIAPGFIAFVFAPAVVVWLVGRACRYVLAGR
jgi:hypothetical protein